MKLILRHLLAGVLLAFLPSIAPIASETAVAADANPVRATRDPHQKLDREDLAAPIREKGEVRVIVGLKTPEELAQAVERIPDQVKEQTVSTRQLRVLQRLAGRNVRKVSRLRHHHFLALTVDAAALEALLTDPEVTSVTEDRPVYPVLHDTPGITRADLAWAEGYRGAGQSVAIIDSGVDKTHPFFSGKVLAEACFSQPQGSNTSYCPSGTSPSIGPGAGVPCPDSSLGCWHGTHVAGIAAGRYGVLSSTTGGLAPDANVMAIQVFQRECVGSSCAMVAYDSDLLAALDHVYSLRQTHNIAAVNMSLGGDLYTAPCDGSLPAYKAIIDSLRSANIATVIAAGNSGNAGALSAPACVSSAISVGSTTKQNAISSFSNSASFLSLLAPGSSVTSSVPGGGYGGASGTSMATPHVAGAWALLKSAKLSATVSEVLAALQNTGVPITDPRNGIVKSLIRIGNTDTQSGALGVVLGQSTSQTVNVALAANGGVATASSIYNNHTGFAPSSAINGDRKGSNVGNGGYWADGTANTFPDSLQINFSGTRSIGEIDVFSVQNNYTAPVEPTPTMTFTQYGLTAFQVQYWNGSAWVDVPGGNVTGNNLVWRKFTFAPISTDRIRVLVNSALNTWSRITEVEAWSASGQVTYQVSGTVTASGSPLAGVAFAATNGGSCTSSNASGQYSCTVPSNWSGVITPSLAGYTFTPPSRSYSGVVANQSAQNYAATAAGAVPVNVALAANGGVATASSIYNNHTGFAPSSAINGDRKGSNVGNGGYWADGTANTFPDSLQINFSGTRSIGEIDVFSVQNNYTAPVEPTPTMTFTQYGLTAFQVQYWNGSAWVDVPGGNVTGNNLVWRKFTFAPISTDRIRVLVNSALNTWSRITEVEAWSASGQVTYQVSGTVTASGSPLAGVAFAATNGGSCTSSNASGQYSCTVPSNWSGVITPSLAGYTFTPPSRSYSGVVANQSAQNYAATAAGAVPVNVALAANGGVATASSIYNNHTGFAPSSAINGDRKGSNVGNGGYWADGTANTFPDSLQINFSGTRSIGEIDVFSVQNNYTAPVEPTPTMTFTQYGLTAFQVQYWNGSAWVDVPGGNVTGNNLVWRKFTFAPISTDRIRVLVNSALNTWSRITEVEAWSASGQVTYQVSGTVTASGSPLAGVAFAATNGGSCTSSNASGQYSCTVPSNWSGVITPSLAGYTFTPPSRSYSGVVANQSAQNYAAAPLTIALQSIASGFSSPVDIAHAGDGSGRLFIVQQGGQIRIINNQGQVLPTSFLDIQSLIVSGGERGLLGIAFHPRYTDTDNGFFYVNYTRSGDGATVIARYRRSTENPDIADPLSEVVLLTVVQPFANHNGGQLHFGPDGYLYIGLGDGGSANDPGNRAQNLTTPLGKMLRIDVDSGSPYAIPASNPYQNDGNSDTLGEIWAYGLRNPWRFSFDRLTGELFIADVGQGAREEINFQSAGAAGGANYGWRVMEGTVCTGLPLGGAPPCFDPSFTPPILEYSHSLGCSVTGGYRYRGSAYPALAGHLFYGDYCSGRVWGATDAGGNWTTTQLLVTGFNISTFGEDEAGEIYVAAYNTGVIYRVVQQ